jgi:heme-binding HmuY-like protein
MQAELRLVRRTMCTLPWLGLWLLTSACAEDLAAESTEADGLRVITSANLPGEFTTRIDASDAAAWVYLSLQSGEEVTPVDPSASDEWDLAFQRFHILTNGGASGGGTTSVAVLVGENFADVIGAPESGYVSDQPDSDDDDTVADSAFAADDGWYDYDPATNRLSPKQIVYVVRTTAGVHYKLALLDYYDQAGTSAHPSFTWAELPAP